MIIGCGGIGSLAAHCLARSGIEHFILCDFDRFEESNLNRQIDCYTDTLGSNKAEVCGASLQRINPDIQCEIIDRKMTFEEVREKVQSCQLLFPAADDFAFSLVLFRIAKVLNIPSMIVVPAGLWARYSIILPQGPYGEELFGLPVFQTESDESLYTRLKDFINSDLYRKGGYLYKKLGAWNTEYFQDFVKGEKPPSQLCPLVWSATSTAVLEAVKLLSGTGKLLALPRYYENSQSGLKARHLYRPSFSSFRILISKIQVKKLIQ